MTIGKILSILLLKQPYYGYIASIMVPEKNRTVKDMEIRSGTSLKLIYNPDWLAGETETRVLGKLVHELLHIILLHQLRRDNRNLPLWAAACDLAVNELLPPALMPEEALTVEKVNRAFSTKFSPGRSAEYYFEGLAEIDDTVDLTLRMGEAEVHLPGEKECLIKLLYEENSSEINMNALKSLLSDITFQAAQEGEIPSALEDDIRGLYNAADINWRNVLKKYITGKGRTVRQSSVKKISRRFADQPGTRRIKGLEALIAIDESGSISDDDIRFFYRELRRISRITKADLHVVRFDTSCSKPVPLDKYLKIRDRGKRGGTDFRPVFETAKKTGSRMIIFFTDGMGSFPEYTDRKVLWVLSGEKDDRMPFGETVRFKGGI